MSRYTMFKKVMVLFLIALMFSIAHISSGLFVSQMYTTEQSAQWLLYTILFHFPPSAKVVQIGSKRKRCHPPKGEISFAITRQCLKKVLDAHQN